MNHQIPLNVKGLSITLASDGIWLNFKVNGCSASVNVCPSNETGIIQQTITAWFNQTVQKIEQKGK